METTLFGTIEGKKEAKERAARIVELWGALRDAPNELAVVDGHIRMLDYFIGRGNKGLLDPNDWDGIIRNIEIDGILTEEEESEWNGKPENIQPFSGKWKGWGGAEEDDFFIARLHPKQIAYLDETRTDLKEEAAVIRHNVPILKAELEDLRRVGPLPDDVCKRHALTPDGRPVNWKPSEAISLEEAWEGSPAEQEQAWQAGLMKPEQPKPLGTWTDQEAMRRSFGTKPRKALRPAGQDKLFEPIAQATLF